MHSERETDHVILETIQESTESPAVFLAAIEPKKLGIVAR